MLQDKASRRLADIRSLLIDMDGVLYRGQQPLPGGKEFLTFARAHGLPFLLLTNNSTLTPKQYMEKLQRMGIEAAEEEILTSAQATAMHLATILPAGSPLYVIGEEGLRTALCDSGYRLTTQDVVAVVVGMDRQLTYEKLKIAALAIRRGARFIGTNPDLTYPSEEGIIPGNGSVLAALQAATTVRPLIIGKPEEPIFRMGLSRLGASPESTAIIGDQLATDILGGQRAGLITIMILTGVVDKAELRSSAIRPDYVYESLPDLQAAWENALSS